MTIQIEREAFEAAAKAEGVWEGWLHRMEGGAYAVEYIELAWKLWNRVRSQPSAPAWVAVTHEEWNVPALGKPVLLCLNGIVQEETWRLDQGDDGNGGGEYFWYRADCDECPSVKDGQLWMPLDSLRALLPTQGDKA